MKKSIFILMFAMLLILINVSIAGVFETEVYFKLEDATEEDGGTSLTLTGSPPFIAAKLGDGISLDGSTQYGQVAYVPTFSNNFTINLWINGDDNPAGVENPLTIHDDGNDVIVVRRKADRGIQIAMWRFAALMTPPNLDSTTTTANGQWYMITVVSNGTNVSLWIDNVLEDSSSLAAIDFNDHLTQLSIGKYHDTSGKFDGVVDDVSITPFDRDAAWIAERWNSGAGKEVDFVPNAAPAWQDNSTNASNTVKSGNTIQFNVNWTDDTDLSQIQFSWNDTGQWINISNITARGLTSLNYSVNMTLTSTNKFIHYRFHANDSDDAWNNTDEQFFQVDIDEINFVSQLPADINIINVIKDLNITYTLGGKLNNITLFYAVNDTDGDNFFFLNGTLFNQGTIIINSTRSDSTTQSFLIEEHNLYPAIFNFDQEAMENITKIKTNITSTAEYIKIEFLNVSKTRNVSFLNIFIDNLTGASNPAEVFYCNASYSSGNPIASNFCTNFFTLGLNFIQHIPEIVLPVPASAQSNTLFLS